MRYRDIALFVPAAILLATSAAVATVHTVDSSGSGDHYTIGEAIAVCSDGDTVSVFPGVYSGVQNRGLTFDGMNLTFASTGGSAVTTIDCGGVDRAFLLSAGHDTTTVLEGLRIINGDAGSLRGTSGGAIRLEPGASAKIMSCQFEGNAANIGGAVSISNGGAAIVDACVFTSNEATLYGGAVDCDQDQSVVRDCDFEGNTAERGGAVRVSYSSAVIRGCDFSGENTATDRGGSLYHTESTNGTIESCTFTDSRATDGGAVYCSMSSPLVSDCVFIGNEATIEGGGFLGRTYDPDLTITGCTFQSNLAAHGGGMNLVGNSMNVSGCDFDENAASNTGGGIYAYVETLSVTGCTFTGNYISAVGGSADGGAVKCYGAVDLLFHQCDFTEGNSAVRRGGGLHLHDCVGDVSECLFDGNAAQIGGGLYARGSELAVTLCAFSNNAATSSGGAMAWTYEAAPNVSGCTVFRNEAPTGGGVYWDNSPGVITESSLVGNSATAGGGVYVLGDGGTVTRSILAHGAGGGSVAGSGLGPEITHCFVFGNAGGDSLFGDYHDNRFLDPLFCDVPGDDYELCANSPCLAGVSPWGELAGAHGQGCPDCESAIQPMSWGSIKALYRRP